MAGLGTLVKQIWQARLHPELLRQVVLPAGAAVTVTANAAGSTYGIWFNIAGTATITTDTLVVGIVASDPTALDVYTIDIGSCLVNGVDWVNAAGVNGGGAAVIAAAHRAEVRTDSPVEGYIPLYSPVWIPNGIGIIARCYGITAVAVAVDISVVCLQGF